MKIKCTICGKESDADANIIDDICARNECLIEELPVACSDQCKRELNEIIKRRQQLDTLKILKKDPSWAGWKQMVDERGVIQ